MTMPVTKYFWRNGYTRSSGSIVTKICADFMFLPILTMLSSIFEGALFVRMTCR